MSQTVSQTQTFGSVAELIESLDLNVVGGQMYELAAELYPICRSITGDGFRKSLAILRRDVPYEVHEVPTGTPVLDWSIPKEWNVREAWVKDPSGRKVIDFERHTLHLLNYSSPIHETMSLDDLKEHVHTLPDQPDWIPYRTSYYKEDWGFCLSYEDYSALEPGEYEVYIDSSLEDGALTYGEFILPGETEDEILFSAHGCHPSLANDNLSGMTLVTKLAQVLQGVKRRYTYRFLIVPGTIGAITWLARNRATVSSVRHGLVVACVGDPGQRTYKRSRRGDAEIDRVVAHMLKHSGQPYEIEDFTPYGYDERQYCSPGFNLAVGSLRRTPHGQYRQYHTSADNMDFIGGAFLGDSLGGYLEVIRLLEGNRRFRNLAPYGEPQLGRRGLYRAIGGHTDSTGMQMAMLWLLNMSDGEHSLLDIAEQSGIPFGALSETAATLVEHDLLKEIA